MQKTDRRRRTLEDDNGNGNEADMGQMEAAENGGRKTAASKARAGSLHRPLSAIHLPLSLIRLRLEAEEGKVTVLASEEEEA